jgi:hypothetical protein
MARTRNERRKYAKLMKGTRLKESLKDDRFIHSMTLMGEIGAPSKREAKAMKGSCKYARQSAAYQNPTGSWLRKGVK